MMSLSVENVGLRVSDARDILSGEGVDRINSRSSTNNGGSAFFAGITASSGLVGAYLGSFLLKCMEEAAANNSNRNSEEMYIEREAPPSFIMLPIAGALLGVATCFFIKSINDEGQQSKIDQLKACHEKAIGILASYGEVSSDTILTDDHLVTLFDNTDEKVWEQMVPKISALQRQYVIENGSWKVQTYFQSLNPTLLERIGAVAQQICFELL